MASWKTCNECLERTTDFYTSKDKKVLCRSCHENNVRNSTRESFFEPRFSGNHKEIIKPVLPKELRPDGKFSCGP